MSILSGYKKFKKYIKTSSGFQLQSLWTSANTVEADDKRTIQTKVGAINGISSSETANSAEIAASTALTNKMNGTINNLSRDLKFPDGVGFYPDIQDGVRGYNTDSKRGADTFTPFKKTVNLGTGTRFDVSLYSNHKKFTADNFIIKIERVTTSQSPTDNDQDNGNAGVNISPTVSYDAEKGIVTVSGLEGIGRFKTYGSTGCIIKSKVEASVWLIF